MSVSREPYQRHVAAVRAREQAEERKLLAAALKRRSDLDPAAVRVVAIPSAAREIEFLPPERRAEYEAHLAAIVAEAAGYPDAASLEGERDRREREELEAQDRRLARQPALQNALDTLCGRCRGSCCQRGGDDAFLSSLSARRWLDAHPDQGPEDLLAQYRSHYAETIVAGGCINQSPDGCVLPRELRSEICNGFYCEPLEAFIVAVGDGEPGTSLVVRRDHGVWNRFDSCENEVEEVLWLEGAACDHISHVDR